MKFAIELALSILTLTTVYLVGHKSTRAPIIGLIAEISWCVYIVYTQQWGLLLMSISLIALYMRMWKLWQ